jgi:hypothetical protein
MSGYSRLTDPEAISAEVRIEERTMVTISHEVTAAAAFALSVVTLKRYTAND